MTDMNDNIHMELLPKHSCRDFRYIRIQGKELASNTLHGKGVFSMCWSLIQNGVMSEEDAEFYKEIEGWVADVLPYPEICNNQGSVICYFKASNSTMLTKRIMPALWLLDKYEHPYFVVYTNYPGEIVYEDEYQVVVKADNNPIIEDQLSWTKERTVK